LTTCGEGLAENAAVPARLGELTASVADVLEVHMEALDLNDPNAREEHAVYGKLVQEHREAAGRLRALADEMAGYRDLPMARHDQTRIASPQVVEAFERFMTVQQQVLALLKERVEQDRRMLAEMRRAGDSGKR
jgi:flagellar biosynthesis chaperone FliJ